MADRHIQRGLVSIFQVQKLLQLRLALRVLIAHIHVDQATVAANAVAGVHHGIADVELTQVFDQRFHVADLLLFFTTARGGPGSKQLGLGDQINAVLQPAKADGQPRSGDTEFFIAGLKLL